jgi:hypothetical protein
VPRKNLIVGNRQLVAVVPFATQASTGRMASSAS